MRREVPVEGVEPFSTATGQNVPAIDTLVRLNQSSLTASYTLRERESVALLLRIHTSRSKCSSTQSVFVCLALSPLNHLWLFTS